MEPSTPTDIGERSQRRRILAAMIASCAEKTYTATTITDIVGAARISRTTFYKRFADKRECFDAAVDACIEEVQEAARDAYSPADPPAEAARKATTAVLELMAAKPDVAQLLCGEAHSVDPSVPRRYRKLAVPALERLWADGSGPPEPHLDPRLAFGRAHVLVFDRLAGGSEARLLELLPELVYLAVAPFAGHDEALRKAQISAGEGGDGRR